jgi:sulfur transfer protein SufE
MAEMVDFYHKLIQYGNKLNPAAEKQNQAAKMKKFDGMMARLFHQMDKVTEL